MKIKRTISSAFLLLAGCSETTPSFYSNVLRSDVFEQQVADSTYDFLLVLDNSQSMSARRQTLATTMSSWVNILNSRKAIDANIALTDTDFFSHAGALIPTSDGRTVINTTSPTIVADFTSMLNNYQDSNTSFWEQGLISSMSAIQNTGRTFWRPGNKLVIIFASDDSDWSAQVHPFGSRPEINPDTRLYDLSYFIDFYNAQATAMGSAIYIFPIVGIDTTRCAVENVGDRYIMASNYMGGLGVSQSVCPADLATSFTNVAQILANQGVTFPLSSTASGTGISVFVDGTLIQNSPDNYIYNPANNAIVFTGFVPKKGAQIQVTYAQQTK